MRQYIRGHAIAIPSRGAGNTGSFAARSRTRDHLGRVIRLGVSGPAGRTAIQITEEQIAAIEQDMERRYRRELVIDFRRQHPDHTAAMSDEHLLAIVDRSLTDARTRGISSSGALLRYVSLSVLISPDFASVPEVKALFDAPGLDVEYKVHLLSDTLIAQLREI